MGKKIDKPGSSPAIKKEAVYWIMAAGGLLLLLAVIIPGSAGFVGRFFNSLIIGLFGFGGIVLPIALIAMAIFGLVAKDVSIPWVRGAIVAWLILAWLHNIVSPASREYVGIDYLTAVYNSGNRLAGGVMGAVLGSLFRTAVGDVLSIVIISVAILIMIMFITGRSFATLIGQGVGRARNFYDERAYQYDEEEEEDYPPHTATKPLRKVPPPASTTKKIKPKPPMRPQSRRKKGQQGYEFSQPVDIDPDDYDEVEDHTILLVDEEAMVIKNQPKGMPGFLKDAKGGHTKANPKILNFEEPEDDEEDFDDIAEDNDYEEDIRTINQPLGKRPATYVEEPYTTPHKVDYAVKPPKAMAQGATYKEQPKPAPVVVEEYEEDFDSYEDEDNNDYNSHHQVTTATPLVRGLVDDDPHAQPQTPLYGQQVTQGATDQEYDEYDHVSRLAGGYSQEDDQELQSPKIEQSLAKTEAELYENFELPPIDFLAKNDKPNASAESRTRVLENSQILEDTLRSFRVEAKVVEVSVGPTVTRYDLAPGPGVKVNSIANLSNDLALSLAAQGIRIEAPIPGKSAVGIEIPNKEPQGVYLREIIECEKFENFSSKLAFAVGKDIAGNPVVADVADMPHLLIAGATGAGKSVCINTLIASLLYKAKPDEVKLLMIDPKVVELSVYNGIPHLLIPVVTDPKKASGALNWAVQEMESRYNAFAETGSRDLKGYNRHLAEKDEPGLPQIVIIIDELADLMMTCKGEVEEAICRLAQKARAAGIHLIVATQRPSVDVITGLIKANIPSRLAFAVSSGTDSRTVLDTQGAEKLLGRGDMLFLPRGQNKPIRIQGGFISDKEVEELVAFLKAQAPAEHSQEMIQQITMPGKAKIDGELDEFFHDAVEFLLSKGKGSTSVLQRQFRIGYNRASRLMDVLEMSGIVGPEDGVKPRKVTITREEYRELYGK